MSNIAVKYMGFDLSTPLILGSCGLSNKLDNLKLAEDNHFGAIVLKSIFEEEIHYQIHKAISESEDSAYGQYAQDYISHYREMESFEKYLNLIRQANESITIPVIASVNCFSSSGWMKYAKMIEQAGAKALEVNFFLLPTDFNKNADNYRKEYFKLLDELKKNISIPFALKTSSYFTDFANFMQQLSYSGPSALVLFNRFYAPDINIDKLEFKAARHLSDENELYNTLRWIGLLSGNLRCDIAATTGVHNGAGLIKLLLAGADVVQAASIFYKKGIPYAKEMMAELNSWMDKKEFKTINDFKGRLSYHNIDNPTIYFRTQFMKYMAGIE